MQALQSEASRLPVDPTLFRTIEKRLDRALSRASRESRWEREEGKHSELRYQDAGWMDRGKRADFMKREAFKEGVVAGDPMSRRNVLRAASTAVTGPECLDVLKGVSKRRGERVGEGLFFIFPAMHGKCTVELCSIDASRYLGLIRCFYVL